MTADILIPGTHAFALYRSGWSGPEVPWSDNQLWAEATHAAISRTAGHRLDLEPRYGSAASWYQVDIHGAESAEDGWFACRARLIIDNLNMGEVPLAWYVGNPSDWPSGVARYPEAAGPRYTKTFPAPDGPRGVWTLAARRHT
jgi:hypothetical protein